MLYHARGGVLVGVMLGQKIFEYVVLLHFANSPRKGCIILTSTHSAYLAQI